MIRRTEPRPRTMIPHDDIVYPVHLPVSRWRISPASPRSGPGSPAEALVLRRRALPAAHVRRLRRLPPLLLAPRLQDQPRRPVPARLPGAELGPARACCGGRPSTAGTISTRTPSSTSTRRASAASSTPISAGSSPPRHDATDYRSDRRPRQIPGAGLARPPPLSAGGPARAWLLADRRLAGPGRRLLLEHGRALARHLLHQLAGPRRRAASATSPATIPATTGGSRSSPWARAGTTTTMPTSPRPARASAGGSTTRPSTR